MKQQERERGVVEPYEISQYTIGSDRFNEYYKVSQFNTLAPFSLFTVLENLCKRDRFRRRIPNLPPDPLRQVTGDVQSQFWRSQFLARQRNALEP